MPVAQPDPDPEADPAAPAASCCGPLSLSGLRRPIEVGVGGAALSSGSGPDSGNLFWSWPFLGPFLVENETSDTRDHCANERTFLSYLRLSIYMAIVSVAIVLSFHLKSQPSPLERRMAQPLGIVFWLLSLSCLVLGFGNYIKTLDKYSKKVAIVQTGWRTQSEPAQAVDKL
ncbi:hypothetical protein AAE478_001677 [Parahypoxylon ruwenzoriense]